MSSPWLPKPDGGQLLDEAPASKHQLDVRVTDDERKSWELAVDGAPLSDWIRNTCNAAAATARSRPKGKP
jgi:hypothetical protein